MAQEKAQGQAARSQHCGPSSAAVTWGWKSPALVSSPSALGHGWEADHSLVTASPGFSSCPSLGSTLDFASPRGCSVNLLGFCDSSSPLPAGINPK